MKCYAFMIGLFLGFYVGFFYPQIHANPLTISAVCKPSSIKLLRGIVIDYSSGMPLSNADIWIQGTSIEGAIQTTTDESGIFEVEISSGIYRMQVKSPRYYAMEVFKSIPFDEETEIQMMIPLQRIVVGQVFALKGIQFSLNSLHFDIHSRSLQELIQILRTNPNLMVEICCHTDSRGDDEYNLNLSQERAEYIVKYLITKGIPESQLTARGYGETLPLNHCTNEVRCSGREHTQNRRLEYVVIGLKDDTIE